MSNRLPSNAGVGVASILLIVVMLCMTVFAALSLLTAKNDGTLTEKTVAYTRAYYQADATAQRMIADVAAALATGGALPDGVTRNGDTLAFLVPVSETANLCVTLTDTGRAYTIDSYGVQGVEDGPLAYDTLTLWQ
ncbi:MAG: hypothetical protein Q4E65_03925 [Clostridia bacterium]|nr:hypothetical protein [Clostridia bacterium]